MSPVPATCRDDDSVLEALRLMRERRVRDLPVVDAQGLLQGILSVTDVVLWAQGEESPTLRHDVSAALRVLKKCGDVSITRGGLSLHE